METILVQNTEPDATENELFEVCLATPTILRQILRQFSNTELLTLSLVNKQWNFEARSVLKGRGNLTARFSRQCTCQSLVALASDLENMQVVPFSGIHVVISHSEDFVSSPNGSGNSCDIILGLIPCKHLSLTFLDPAWINCKDCEALVLVTRIMEVYCGSLETFSLTLEPEEYEEIYEQVFQQQQRRGYPYLKTFKVRAGRPDEGSLMNFLKTLVSRAPNLQELQFDGFITFEENILTGSSAVLVPNSDFYVLSDQVCESMMSSIRAKKIIVLAELEDFNVDLLNTVVPMVLQTSRASLTSLRMDLLFAVPLMCYGICLENVTKLEICMLSNSLRRIQPPILSLIKGFDFTHVFPKLESVKIQEVLDSGFATHHITGFVEQGNEMMLRLGKSLADRAIKIKQLTLIQSCWDSAQSFFWTQIFPNITKLEINIGNISPLPFTALWEGFVNLEELFVTSVQWSLSMNVNLDSVFCGIFPEEVAELEGKDDEYLKAVNIVPVMPSIGCMRDLKSLTMDHTLPAYTLGGRMDRKPNCKYLFSKVTALVGFSRCPALAVTFVTGLYTAKALSHMEPYVSFIIQAPDPSLMHFIVSL